MWLTSHDALRVLINDFVIILMEIQFTGMNDFFIVLFFTTVSLSLLNDDLIRIFFIAALHVNLDGVSKVILSFKMSNFVAT